jgi:hypothetical protein
MKLLKYLSFACLLTTSAASASVFFYADSNFSGGIVDGVASPTQSNAEYRAWLWDNDELSSVVFNGNSECVLLAKDSIFRGNWLFLTEDTPSLGALGWNDKVSSTVSFITNNGCNESAIGVLYRNANGQNAKFPLVPGGRAEVMHWFNDRASSIRVPAGMTIILFENKNYGGDFIEFSGDGQIVNLSDYGWNDKVSSFVVL